MKKGTQKKPHKVKNYEVWSGYLCNIFAKPLEEWSDHDKVIFDAYYKFHFPFRREYMTALNAPSVKAVKSSFPYLFHKNQVFTEFELIADKKNMFDAFTKNVGIYAPEVIKRTTSNPLKDTIESQLKKADGESKSWIEKVGSLLLLPRYMAEERKGIIVFSNETVPTDQEGRPYIICDKDVAYGLQKDAVFRIIIDDIELCVVNNLMEAFFALMAAYYIFNTVYPSCCPNTFHCLEKLYVEYAEDPDEVAASAEELISALKDCGRQKKERKNNDSSNNKS